MEKKELAIRILVDEKEVNKAMMLLGEDIFTKEEIDKRFFDREPFKLDTKILGNDGLAFVATVVGLVEADNRGEFDSKEPQKKQE